MTDGIDTAGQGAPRGPRPALKVVAGPARGTTIAIGDDPVVLGRDEQDEARLGGDPEVSRRHAKVEAFDGRLLIEDLGSTNGTFVNGGQVAGPTVVGPGDAIWVGTSTMLVQPADEPLPEVTPLEPPTPSAEAGLLSRLADVSVRRPKRILAGIGVFFLIAAVLGGPVVTKLRDERGFDDPNSEYVKAQDGISAAGGEFPVPLIVLLRPGTEVNSPRARALTKRVERRILADKEHFTRAVDFYNTRGSPLFLSRDRKQTYITAFYKDIGQAEREDVAEEIRVKLENIPQAQVGGAAMALYQLRHQVADDLHKAELLGFPLLLLVSIFVFRGVVAAMLPLFVGIVTIFGTFLALRIINGVHDVNVFALNIVIALGLGLAIDYSLFIVSRYREELAKVGRGRPGNDAYGATMSAEEFAGSQAEALRRALLTSGRTIIFSAGTVAVAMASLTVFRQPFVSSMGLGGAVTALVAVTVALVALPALLGVLGPRVNAGAPKRWKERAMRDASEEQRGFWYRLSVMVMRRPGLVALSTALLLVVIGLAFTRIGFTGVNEGTLPDNLTAKHVNTVFLEDFPVNPSATLNLLVKAPADAGDRVQALNDRIRRLPGVADVLTPEPVHLKGDNWTIAVQPWDEGLSPSTRDLTKKIRDLSAGPVEIRAAGEAPAFLDQQSSFRDHLPYALILLVAFTIVILFVMTGSAVLPIKSLLMNVLTLSATLGLLVLIFQDGRFESLLGFQSQGAIDATQPILIVGVAFGLSTDYAVFLLTRINEARVAGAGDREAVAIGLQRTGRIVTQAALLFCLAIGAFTLSKVVFIKQVGVGTAAAVIIDSTIMRGLLVPALMAMLGARNWWAPGPLRRLHNKIGLSEG